jgi:anthranilate synthase
MRYEYTSPSGITVARTTSRLDYDEGIAFLTEALDEKRGAFFSSGVEYPDRYTRWDFGFVDPPIEIVGRGRAVTFRALNPRGVRLLRILAPVVTDGMADADCTIGRREIGLRLPEPVAHFAEEERSRQPSSLSPLRRLIEAFAGIEDGFLGAYGAFGYDLIFQFEPMPLHLARAESATDLHLYLPDRIYVLDRRLERAQRHDFTFARDNIRTARASRRPFAPLATRAKGRVPANGKVQADQSAADFAQNVEAARRRIIAGDLFEVVLSRTFAAPYGEPPSALFRRFREINPSPYEFLIQLGDQAIVGASPEMFVRVEGRRIESCPIAGTVRRGGGPMEDAENVRALLNSAKDEAELTMCTDVDRNDKARICEPGSVRLLERRLIERYAGLFHTVDHVEGRLRPGLTGIDGFLSHMWAVTLTGAPKRMAVSAIETLETVPRGWYGGAIGGLALNGDVNTGITIRTAILSQGAARYRAGASLVYDSVGAEEARETELKATAFFRAVGGEAPRQSVPKAPPQAVRDEAPKVLMIDNEDSFVHCLADYFRQAGAAVATYRWGLDPDDIAAMKPDLVVHSPGPGRPGDFGQPALVRALAGRGLPQFGVCLGLQGIAEAFGGRIALLAEPRHGKVWEIRHDGSGLFDALPSPMRAGAYHSLHAPAADLPGELVVTARNEDGLVMALEHESLPVAAVQFHPESILSLGGGIGHALIANVLAKRARAASDVAAPNAA